MLLDNPDLQNLIIQNLEFADFLRFKMCSCENSRLLFNSDGYISYDYSIIDDVASIEIYVIRGENHTRLNYIKSFLDHFGFALMQRDGRIEYIYITYEGHSSIFMIPIYLDLYNSLCL